MDLRLKRQFELSLCFSLMGAHKSPMSSAYVYWRWEVSVQPLELLCITILYYGLLLQHVTIQTIAITYLNTINTIKYYRYSDCPLLIVQERAHRRSAFQCCLLRAVITADSCLDSDQNVLCSVFCQYLALHFISIFCTWICDIKQTLAHQWSSSGRKRLSK